MTIAFDAATTAFFTGDLVGATLQHTPVGTPRGIICLIAQNLASDEITTVQYGGITMTEVTGSPLLGAAGDEPMTCYGHFLGAGIPAGVQNVEVDTTNTRAKTLMLISVTAAADTEIDATQTLDTVVQNPSLTLATTASTNTFDVAILGTGVNAVTNVAPGAAYTQRMEQAIVGGARCSNGMNKTTNGTGGNITVDWTTDTSEDALVLAVAIREIAGAGGATVVDPFGMSGIFGG